MPAGAFYGTASNIVKHISAYSLLILSLTKQYLMCSEGRFDIDKKDKFSKEK